MFNSYLELKKGFYDVACPLTNWNAHLVVPVPSQQTHLLQPSADYFPNIESRCRTAHRFSFSCYGQFHSVPAMSI